MSNMSYCRFHNTLADFYDCVNDLDRRANGEDEDGEPVRPLRDEEAEKAVALISAARDLVARIMEEQGQSVDEIDIQEYIDDLQAQCEMTCNERAAEEERK